MPSLSNSSFSRTEIKLEMCSRFSVEELTSRLSRSALSANTTRPSRTCSEEPATSSLPDVATVAASKLRNSSGCDRLTSPTVAADKASMKVCRTIWDCCFSSMSRKAAPDRKTLVAKSRSRFWLRCVSATKSNSRTRRRSSSPGDASAELDQHCSTKVCKHATLFSSNFVQARRLKFVLNSGTRCTVATTGTCVHDSFADFAS